MTDSELIIAIKTLFDNKGSEAAKDALKEITKGTRDLGEQEKEASKFTEILHHNHRILHTILHELGSEIAPGAGRSLAAMMYGPIGAGVALLAIVHSITEGIKKQAEEAKKLIDEQSNLNTDIWTAQRDGINKAAEAAEDYASSLSKVREHLTGIKEAEEEDLAVQKEQADSKKSELDAKEKQDLEAIENEEKSEKAAREQNKIKGGEAEFSKKYEDQKSAVKKQYEELKKGFKLGGDVEKIDTEEGQLKARLEREKDLEAAAGEWQKEYEESLRAPKTKYDEKQLEKANAAQKKLDEKADEALNGSTFEELQDFAKNKRSAVTNWDTKKGTVPTYMETEAMDAEEKSRAAAKALEQARAGQARVESLNKTVEDEKAEQKKLKDSAEAAVRARDENIKAVDALTAKIHQEIAVIDERIKGAKEVAKISGSQTQIQTLNGILNYMEDMNAKYDDLKNRADAIMKRTGNVTL